MPQREGETDYKYEDYASEMATYRNPQTDAMVKKQLKITLDSGTAFDLNFIDNNKVEWKSGSKSGTDWCEVVEVEAKTYFIDMTFANEPRQCQTFIVNTVTRQALGVHTNLREGDVGNEPRAVHSYSAGVLGDPSRSAYRTKTGADTRPAWPSCPLQLQPQPVLRTCLHDI